MYNHEKYSAFNRSGFFTFGRSSGRSGFLRWESLTKVLDLRWHAGDPNRRGCYQPLGNCGAPLYPANQAASFDLGIVPHSGPLHMAFDGANIWVTNYGMPCQGCGTRSQSFVRATARSGYLCRRHRTGGRIAFDGANIWVANYGGNM